MLEIFSYEFMQNAIIAGVLVSIISGIIGSLIVINRMLFLAGGVAHASYGGIGMALYFGLPIFLGASIFSVLVALLIAFIAINEKDKIDTFIGVIWATGMSIGIVFIDLTPGYSVDLLSYLFGSILSVSSYDIYMISVLLIIIALFVTFYYQDIVALSYDSEFATLRGINVRVFYTLILIFCSLSIVVAIKLVGLILVIALFSIPTYIALKISKSLAQIMIFSGFFAICFTLSGLLISYFYDISSGASIILVSAFVFIISRVLGSK